MTISRTDYKRKCVKDLSKTRQNLRLYWHCCSSQLQTRLQDQCELCFCCQFVRYLRSMCTFRDLSRYTYMATMLILEDMLNFLAHKCLCARIDRLCSHTLGQQPPDHLLTHSGRMGLIRKTRKMLFYIVRSWHLTSFNTWHLTCQRAHYICACGPCVGVRRAKPPLKSIGKKKLVPAVRPNANGQESRYSCRCRRLSSGHCFCLKMVSEAISEHLNFWGSMPPDPLRCCMLSTLVTDH